MISRLVRASEDRDNNTKPAPEVLKAQICIWQTQSKQCIAHDTSIMTTKKASITEEFTFTGSAGSVSH